jgi:di/tricarboxylate transporter
MMEIVSDAEWIVVGALAVFACVLLVWLVMAWLGEWKRSKRSE